MNFHFRRNLFIVLILIVFISHFSFASSAKINLYADVDSIDQNEVYKDTLFQFSELDITIEHHLQNHFKLKGNTIQVGPASSEMAATFNDPSRALYRHTAISMNNDQANGIIYRGLPSQATIWSIYGAEIVNPNHLSNAGTLTDQASASAGGVLAIPFDVVNRFEFNASPQKANALNALSGNLNFDFDRKSRRFFKIGLLGMEASYQGEGKSGIKIHGRYSTVGLLSDLGVDFDGESIDFQDIFLQMNLSENLKFFSILGSSNNFKSALGDSTNVETVKDIQNIEYRSRLLIQGLHLKNNSSSHTLIFSYKKDDWASAVSDMFPEFRYTDGSTNQLKSMLSYRGDHTFGNNIDRGQFRLALNASVNNINASVFERFYDNDFLSLDPSVSWNKFFNQLGGSSLELGLGASYDTQSKTININPTLSMQWAYKNQIIDLSSAFISHRLDPIVLNDVSMVQPYRSWSSALSWKLMLTEKRLALLIRVFNLTLSKLPVAGEYSPILNSISYVNQALLNLTGKARTTGIECMIDKNISDKFYLNINTSLFNSEYQNENGDYLNSEYSFGHISNLNVSYKYTTKKGHAWSYNIAGHIRGGAYSNSEVRPIDAQQQLGSYWRVDFRMQYGWKNSVLVLDIQNILNRQNDAYYFYDDWTGSEILQKQLGLIPVLSYKRHF